jgi:hypothetical protein
MTGFDSRRYQILWEVVGLERGPLSFVSTIEELLGRNGSGSCLENREHGLGDPLRWPSDTLYRQKLALISPTRGGRSVGIVRLRTKTTEFVVVMTDIMTSQKLYLSSWDILYNTKVKNQWNFNSINPCSFTGVLKYRDKFSF